MRSSRYSGAVHESPPAMLDFLGMIITEVDRAATIRRGMEIVEGLVVMIVGWGGATDTAGVATGDIISAVDGKPTRTLKKMEECLSAHQPQTPIIFHLRRAGTRLLVAIPFKEYVSGDVHRIDSRSCSISRIKSLRT